MDDDYRPWSEQRRTELLAAGAALAAAVERHSHVVAALSTDDDVPALFAEADVVRDIALAYADALFEYTGTGYPFGVLETLKDAATSKERAPKRRGLRRRRL